MVTLVLAMIIVTRFPDSGEESKIPATIITSNFRHGWLAFILKAGKRGINGR